MQNQKLKIIKREQRHQRIRKSVIGSEERPRLFVYRSHKNIYAQIIDDSKHKTLFSLSTLNKEIKTKNAYGGNIKAAELLGEMFARQAKEKGISKVVFDKGAYSYHGRVKSFVESARKGGLKL